MVRERADRGEGAKSPAPAAPMGLSIIEIRQLLKLMDANDLEELVIEQERDGVKLTLRKPPPAVAMYADGEADGYDMTEPAGAEAVVTKDFEIVSPLVGVVRASMKAGGKPLIGLGDIVREGQVVAAIESLNVHNEVEATVSGRVREIMIEDGQSVEYGQPLVILDPLNV
ncbi:MAG: acetyl-CoA carboxylase biotin carboxyl carrier protein [Ktedonobacterales bacterium]